MNIGEPQREIEIVPVTLPVPEVLPVEEPAGAPDPREEPRRRARGPSRRVTSTVQGSARDRRSRELLVEPIVGWRAWGLVWRRIPGFRPASVAQERALRLVPVGAGRGVWPPLEPFRAACRMEREESPAGHRSPVLDCSCGIYASDTLRSLVLSGGTFPPVPVIGMVSMWGRIVEHRTGWRAEYAYPSRLRLLCGACAHEGAGEGRAERVLVGAEGLCVPLCGAHLPSQDRTVPGFVRRGDRGASAGLDAADVERELLDTYGIDLLPFGSVQSVFEREPVAGQFGFPLPARAIRRPARVRWWRRHRRRIDQIGEVVLWILKAVFVIYAVVIPGLVMLLIVVGMCVQVFNYLFGGS